MSLWRRWVALLSREEPATAVALFRVGIGLCVLVTLLGAVQAGVVDVLWVDRAHGGLRSLGSGNWLVSLLGGPTPDVVWRLVAAGLFFGVAVVAGIGGRITALALLQIYIALVTVNGHAGGSYDQLMTNGLWLLVLAPSTRTLSLDCRLRTGAWWSGELAPAWPRWVIAYQIVLCYWTTGLQKVSIHWTPGGDASALYYILQQPTWQRADMSWVAWLYPLTQVGTVVTWWWEFLAPLWLLAIYYQATADRPGRLRAAFVRWRVRGVFIALGLVFHAALLALMDVGPFPWVSLAYYTAMFTPAEYARAWAGVRGRLSRVPTAAAPTSWPRTRG